MVCCSNVEDQDSSSEGGLSSNWWVLGSQGRDPLSVPGDATLQTLPQLTLSSPGTQNGQQQRQSTEGENATKNSTEQSRRESREGNGNEQRKENSEKQSDVETSPTRRDQIEEGGEKREHKQHGENENPSNDEGNLFVITISVRNLACSLYRIENNAIHSLNPPFRCRTTDATSTTNARSFLVHRTIIFRRRERGGRVGGMDRC